jgi:hypothetical protein
VRNHTGSPELRTGCAPQVINGDCVPVSYHNRLFDSQSTGNIVGHLKLMIVESNTVVTRVVKQSNKAGNSYAEKQVVLSYFLIHCRYCLPFWE